MHGIWTWPFHAAPKLSPPTPAIGEAPFQLKLTVGSRRLAVGVADRRVEGRAREDVVVVRAVRPVVVIAVADG